ncbi:MAG: hypothetical protein BMS9Abin29_1578 [Gemmatimonadota bacterium]|nr:MAG: hypothetical protein BMS9Abin29_1578 [Gemmatimonadota bacterium]
MISDRRTRTRPVLFQALLFLPLVAGCAATTGLPKPRSLVVRSGARLTADLPRMAAVNDWLLEELDNIVEDPSFFIATRAVKDPVYPWEGFTIAGDTATVRLQGSAPDARQPYEVYAHLHLMKKMNRLDEWLPDAVGLEGYELERAILARVSDAWLYGRTLFDLAPYAPLDELIFANENGYLDAFILTARAAEFRAERRRWLDENPNATQEYRAWFRRIFERDPKGLR